VRTTARRLLAAGTGLSAGIAVGFLVTDGDPIVLAIAVAVGAAAIGVAYLIISAEARPVVMPVVAFAIAIRIAAAVALHDGLLAAGRHGFVTGDDAAYADLSWRLAQIMHGDPAPFSVSAESHLLSTFVYLEAAVFYVLGPKVLVVEILNAAMGGLLVGFVFEIARRLFQDLRAGMVAASLVAIYPSLVLWSSLNLIDSLVVFLIAVVLWLVVSFAARPAWWLVPASFAPLLLLESLRDYVFIGLALVIPASVLVAPRLDVRNRIALGGLALALAAIMLGNHFAVLPIPSLPPAAPAGPSPAVGVPATPSPSAAAPAIPSLVDLEAERAAMGTGANTNYSAQCAGDATGSSLRRTLRQLPCAAAYVLFAPFPWSVRRVLDLFPIPEMLVWYFALAGGVFVLIRRWRSWRLLVPLVPLVLFVGGTLLVFLVAEGNVGTLYRHRAMVIPFVIIGASPAFALMLTRALGAHGRGTPPL
jgi:hypothetical protein